jgi:hypothetical protein
MERIFFTLLTAVYILQAKAQQTADSTAIAGKMRRRTMEASEIEISRSIEETEHQIRKLLNYLL